MFDARRLLDAVVGGAAKPPAREASGEAQGQSPVSSVLDALLGGTKGGQGDDYVQKAKEFINRHPGLAEAALMSVAGILLGGRKPGGIAAGAARLGGLALIGTLAYKAYQNYQAGKPLLDVGQAGVKAHPSHAAFDPASLAEDDALLFARAMIAAVAADGRIDNRERERIVQALSRAGIDPEVSHWVQDELESPATVDDLGDAAKTPEKAAQIYAAARLAVDPDTRQEREFLRELAEALDLDPQLVKQIDDGAVSVRV
jgi:uncharacterized membrane protein YebE (DUF533 family)